MNESYFQYTFSTTKEYLKDILIAELSTIGFDGFEETSEGLLAYISSRSANETEVEAIANRHGVRLNKKFVPEQNWNALWESNFQPVIIAGKVGIRAAFHPPFLNIPHEIIITPKMSFGTGHHATTYMMIENLCTLDVKNKSVFDFGTGTGVLAILAEKLGASHVTAVDHDAWSIENAKENIVQNNCSRIELALKQRPPVGRKYNIILANINKNTIIEYFSNLVIMLQPGAYLMLSGLLATDKDSLVHLAQAEKLTPLPGLERRGWILLQFVKN